MSYILRYEDLRICAATIRIWQHVILCHHALYPWVWESEDLCRRNPDLTICDSVPPCALSLGLRICAATIRILQNVILCHHALYPWVWGDEDLCRHHPDLTTCDSMPPFTLSLGFRIWGCVPPPSGSENMLVLCHHALYHWVWGSEDLCRLHLDLTVCDSVPPCTISLGVWGSEDLCRHHPDLTIWDSVPPCTLSLGLRIWGSVPPPSGSDNMWFFFFVYL